MKTIASLTVLAGLLSSSPLSCDAWVTRTPSSSSSSKNAVKQQPQTPPQWKQAVAGVGAAFVVAGAPLVSHALDFSGSYEDPNHPYCTREIENIGRIAMVHGTDGTYQK